MDLQEISLQLQAGKAKIVKTLVQQAIDEGIPAQKILEEGLLAGMNVVGVKFKNNEVFVPEVLVAARAMNQGANLLKPLLMESGVRIPSWQIRSTDRTFWKLSVAKLLHCWGVLLWLRLWICPKNLPETRVWSNF